MPEHIHIPSDFERLPEYRMLCSSLRLAATARRNPGLAQAAPPTPGEGTGPTGPRLLTSSPTDPVIEAIATHLWMRLWVELTYQARTSNRPGWLGDGQKLFEESVGALFGDDCPPVKLLLEAKVLEERPIESAALSRDAATDLYCACYEECNRDKAGDYVTREKRGQLRSAYVRQDKELVQNALSLAQLLPPEKYRKADGTTMNDEEAKGAMLVVQRVDRALMLPVRNPGAHTQGLVADACAVGSRYSVNLIKHVCFWLLEGRNHPATPKTTEQILSRWEEIMVMAGAKELRIKN